MHGRPGPKGVGVTGMTKAGWAQRKVALPRAGPTAMTSTSGVPGYGTFIGAEVWALIDGALDAGAAVTGVGGPKTVGVKETMGAE